MKDKRIWTVICCILVIGSGVTYYTNSYVRSQGGSAWSTEQADADLSTSAAAGSPGAIRPGEGAAAGAGRAGAPETAAAVFPGGTPPESPAGAPGSAAAGTAAGTSGIAADEAPAQEAVAETAEAGMISEDGPGAAGQRAGAGPGAAAGQRAGAGPGAAAGQGAAPGAVPEAVTGSAESLPISPLTGAKGKKERAADITDYRQRLTDLDNQIQKMREEDSADASNVYSIKTSAETELKLWEGELGTIYNALLEMLSQDDAAALASEHQEWMKNRDKEAAEGAAAGNSSSVEGLGYAATLVSLTRDRAYELAGRYEEANGITPEHDGEAGESPAVP